MRKNIRYAMIAIVGLYPAAGTAQESIAASVDSESQVVISTELMALGDGIVPFRCPIEQIRTAYQNLVNPDDALMALAIEKQTLAICRQSQEALIRIAENEVKLRELFEPIMVPVVTAPVPPIAQILSPEPERNVMESLPVTFQETVGSSGDADPIVEDGAEEEAPTTDFALGALMRDPDGRRAILVRGEKMFTVREGNEIDAGNRVVRIEEESVTIVDPNDNEFVLE